jgi:plasmid stabilization system protein ParE
MAQPLVTIHPKAVAEAREAVKWYRERSQAAADSFVAEMDHAIERIIEAPDRWPPCIGGTRRYLLHRFPFSIVYRKQGPAIQVIAVAHGHRKPDYWKTR